MARIANTKFLEGKRNFKEALKQRRATITNYGGSDIVEMQWDLNENAIADQIFRIRIGDKVALLNKEELLHWLDAV